MKYIASCSFGKDSLAMVLMLIERGLPLDEVVFYDTGMEFQAIYDLRDDMLPIFQQHGIKYTTLYPDNPFLYDMLERPVKGRERRGYGWCGGLCRWGTTCKLRTIDQYAERQGAKVYVGIAADETPRLQKERKPYKLFPLAEFGMTEADCLQYCYSADISGWRAPSGSMTFWTVFPAGAVATKTSRSSETSASISRSIGKS